MQWVSGINKLSLVTGHAAPSGKREKTIKIFLSKACKDIKSYPQCRTIKSGNDRYEHLIAHLTHSEIPEQTFSEFHSIPVSIGKNRSCNLYYNE